ncbi:hypothetical protein KIL84_009527 [Mauremys mutica]|uniref:Uncharacterized protein n=1 Tax=Mauremys mutica TaxID=74926 RepID=A0A9D3XXN5_9SAUR|nr:hypothetical protein KIL84_017908 [Mauremys mutica]KAH1187962.1 hypothetical protein KIL84_009527 [Mauremys mutica]
MSRQPTPAPLALDVVAEGQRGPYQPWASRAEQLSAGLCWQLLSAERRGHRSQPGLGCPAIKAPHFSAQVPWGVPSVPSPCVGRAKPGGSALRCLAAAQSLGAEGRPCGPGASNVLQTGHSGSPPAHSGI